MTLTWKGRGSADKEKAKQKLLGDWANSHGEDDKGVSIEFAFGKYDPRRTGEIDASHLQKLWEDLNIEVNKLSPPYH